MPSKKSDKLKMSREERRERGRLCRNKVGRVDQAKWNPKDRKFDVIDLLIEAQHGRIASLLPIKWRNMAASPSGSFGALRP